MPGAPVEGLPGGLLDHLARTRAGPEPSPVAQLCLAGAWAAAARLPAPAAPDSAWRGLAVHGSLLGLPDGACLALSHAAPRVAELSWQTPTDGATPADAAECHVVDAVLSLRTARSLLPPYVTDPGMVAAAGGLAGGLARLTALREPVSRPRPDLAGHLGLLAADLHRRAGDEARAAAETERALDLLRRDGGLAGQACAALVVGDAALARFSSPLTWDCVLEPSAGPASNLLPQVEALEMGGAGPADVGAAGRAYDRAEALFGQAGHAWGLAVVRHRRAHLAMLRDGPAAAVPLLAGAADGLAGAGDRGGAVLARVHAALAALAADDLPERAATAAEIAAWTQGDGGPAPGLALALLVTRVGRHWLTSAPERAAAAFRVAEAVHLATDAPHQRSFALVDQAEAARAMGDRTAERLLLLEALDVADGAPVPEPAAQDSPAAAEGRQQRRVLLAAALYTVGLATDDVPAMERAAAMLGTVQAAPAAGGAAGPASPADGGAVQQSLPVVAFPDRSGEVVALLMRGQAARDDEGDTATAEELFTAAGAAADSAPEDERDLLQAFVAAYRRDHPAAAAAFRRHVARRLAALEDPLQNPLPDLLQDPATPPPGGDDEQWAATRAALLLQGRRMLRLEAMLFFVRVRHPADAREQLEDLAATADPWWSGLGPEWEQLLVLGSLRELEGDLAGAARTLEAAARGAEEVRQGLRRDDAKTAFAGNSLVQDVHRAAARVALRRRADAVASGDAAAAAALAAEAVRYAEDARARALLDMLAANAEHAAGSPDLAEAVPAWRSATAHRRSAQDRLHALVARADADSAAVRVARDALAAADRATVDLEDRLRDRAPAFWAGVSPEVRAGSLAEVAATLPAGTVVLQYSVQQPEMVGWALTRDGMAAATWDVDQRTLERAVGRLVRGYVDGVPEAALSGTADEIAQILLAPFDRALEDADDVVVVGSGPTLRLPFAALPWHGGPLGLARTVTTAPSLSTLRYLGTARRAAATPAGDLARPPAGPALVVGDPRGMALPGPGGPRAQRPLPAAGLEARYVAGLVPGARLLLGGDATEAAVRAALPGAPLVHLATHGSLDPAAPMESAVLLADGEVLTVAELVGLRLDADLVVLSACHSGEGAVVGGDDVLGLGRALLAAGARSAVLTLWAIDDVSGALLMGEMHRRRRAGEATPTALRHAMGWLRGLDRAAADDALAALRDAVHHDGDPMVAGTVGAEVDRLRGITRRTATPTPFSHPRHWAPYVVVGPPGGAGPDAGRSLSRSDKARRA